MNWKFILKMMGFILCLICFIILAVIIHINYTEPLALDRIVRDFCYEVRGEKYGLWYWFFRLVTEFGGLYVICGIVVLIIILTKCDFKAVLFLAGILCVAISNVGLKNLFMRERPLADFRWMIESSASFPSGHATTVGFVYPFLLYIVYNSKMKKCYRYVLYISFSSIIPLVMLSRLILGVHYLTDVIAGVCMGIMIFYLEILLYKICEKTTFMKEGLLIKLKKRIVNKNK